MTIVFNPTTFRVLYPQFANVTTFPDVKLQADFDLATAYVSPEVCGDMSEAVRTQALNLMTAHLLALGVIIATGNYSGQPGTVIASRVGDVQVQLQPPPQRGQWRWWLNHTPYGAQLIALLEIQAAAGFFVGGLPERAAFRRVGGGFGGVF